MPTPNPTSKNPRLEKVVILDRDAPILREVAKPVSAKEITGEKIRSIIERMKVALHSQEDGVAIAAPQIGESLRIFIVNGKAIHAIAKDLRIDEVKEDVPDIVFVNPEIQKFSKRKRLMEEGCLSVRWLYGEVSRYEKATVRAYNEEGKLFTKGASGLMAQIFQHEIDHLDGILFIDKAKNVRDLPPEKEGSVQKISKKI